MVRGRVSNIVERFTRNRDYVRLANFERVRGFDAEWKRLRRPTENSLPNLAPLWANGNLSADSSHTASVGILKSDVNVAVRFDFCVNNAASERVPLLLRRHSLLCVARQIHIRPYPFPCVNLRGRDRLNGGFIRRNRRLISLGNPPIFAVKALTLTRRDKDDVWRFRRFGECRCNDKHE